jgi:hypothetical protein
LKSIFIEIPLQHPFEIVHGGKTRLPDTEPVSRPVSETLALNLKAQQKHQKSINHKHAPLAVNPPAKMRVDFVYL